MEPNAHYKYRLKQIDFDGTMSYSDEVELFTKDVSEVALSEVFPNPANRLRSRMTINVAEAAQAEVEVYDVRGPLASADSRRLSAGENTLSLEPNDMANGAHFAKVQVGERTFYRQFFVAN